MALDPERKRRTTEALEREGWDGFLCTSPSGILLLTGYWPVVGPSVAIFTHSGDVHVLLPEDEAELAAKTSGARLHPYKSAGLEKVGTPLESLRGPLEDLAQALHLNSARLGIQAQLGMQPATYASSAEFRTSLVDLLKEIVPKVLLVAADDVIETMKARKTAVELECMRHAAQVASAGFDRAAEVIQPGLREPEVAAAAQHAFEISEEASYFQRSYGFFYCMSGRNSALGAAAFARTRQRRIEAGDLVMIHANTCGDGYWTDITRTWTAGEPSRRQQEMRAAIDEARHKALQVVRPGVAASQVDEAARQVMQSHGMGEAFVHPTGHGVGFAAANPNGYPRIHPCSPDVLEEGMTFNVEPAAYFAGYGGMRHCDVVAVTSDGTSVLTHF